LIKQLRIIFHILRLAASAYTEMLAKGRDPMRRGLLQGRHSGLCQVLLLFLNFYIDDITRNGMLDKDNQIICFTYSLAAFCNINNLHILNADPFTKRFSHVLQKYE